jgi:hypothetical protein
LAHLGKLQRCRSTAPKFFACRHGVVPEVQCKIDEFVTSLKCFKLIWTSQNEVVEIECGRYTSIPEASDDLAAAKARLDAEYPASVDFHYLYDIKAGTWRIVPTEPARRVGSPP